VLLAGLSNAVDNMRVVPVNLLTASSAMFTWKQYLDYNKIKNKDV
jgi:hypothetical protein